MKKYLISFATLVLCSSNVFAGDLENAKDVIRETQKAVEYFEKNMGREADILKEFNTVTPNKSVWGPKEAWEENYFSTYECSKYIVAAHAHKPHLAGRNLKGLKDKKGNFFFQHLCQTALANPKGGWVEYWWPKGADNTPHRKIAYIKSAGKYQLTAGIYSDTLTLEEVSKLIK